MSDHSEKMCAMTCCPCHLDLAKIKALSAKPGFICKSCGHVAEKEENLCDPQAL